MKYSFGDVSDQKSRASKIRALFVVGSTIQEHTEHCIANGVWTDSELRAMAGAGGGTRATGEYPAQREADFMPCSFGFRPKKTPRMAGEISADHRRAEAESPVRL
jgi:hypothetical protein